MGRLDNIALEQLHEIKERTDEGKPRERIIAAIGRKQGDELETLATVQYVGASEWGCGYES
jgi:hypothetical protein